MADELVTIGDFQFVAEAEAARMYLEAEGIRAFLADAETVTMDWLLGNAIGYVKIQVPREQAEEALAVLEKMRARREKHEGDDEEGDIPACLSCGAKLPAARSSCSACGWSYANDEGEPAEEEPPDEWDDLKETETASGMDALRSLKRPVFMFFLAPLIIVAGLTVLFLLLWLVGLIPS